jgi:DNA mismatch repair ATPase MutS
MTIVSWDDKRDDIFSRLEDKYSLTESGKSSFMIERKRMAEAVREAATDKIVS